ncbi:MAG: MerR family DNA-binding transcriptional regulator [bacterium]|nr:MerR family DNA-binding transcriptional regulator [bacterium]
MNERYLSIREVSKIIGVTPLTLRNWDRKGLLAAYRNPVNNYRMYRYADVADFVADIKKSGPARGQPYKIPVRIKEEFGGETAV